MAKIMLVEDDKSLREIYGVRLAAEGYEIISAGDGEEALAMAVKEKPDLILSDVMMPKISGFDMLDIIRATPETKDLKIIMMTALSSEDQRARGESLGANKYLVKSQVGIEDVVRAVHEVIGDIPTPATPKPVEFTKPIATENIETKPEPEVAPELTPAPQEPIQPVSAPEPEVAPQESSLPQPTAPIVAEAPIPTTTPETPPVNPLQPTTVNENPTTPEVISPVAPSPVVNEPIPEVAPVQPVTPPAQPASTPEPEVAPQESSLPQPTAPFSTAAPHSSLGERVINPLNPIEDKPDISNLINQELNDGAENIPPQPPQV